MPKVRWEREKECFSGQRRSRCPEKHLILVLLFTSFAWMPLLAPGYFLKAHDARHSLFFLVEFDQAIRDGAFYPRWAIDQAVGYGYPLFVFYAPLAYYIAEAFHLLGFSITWAVKLTFLLGFLAGAFAMYFLAEDVWGGRTGALAAVLFTYAPYHLVDIYVRCALAEFLAFSFIPLCLLAFRKLMQGPSIRKAVLAGFALAALILTHQITALMFAPLLGAYVLFEVARSKGQVICRRSLAASGLLMTVLAGILALGISAAYWVPMLAERSYIVQEQWMMAKYNYQKQFVYLFQFFDPTWDYGYAIAGPDDRMPLQLGVMPLTLALAAIVLGWKRREARGELAFWGGVTLAALFLMTSASIPIWQTVPLLSLVQFPWRFLAITAVSLALLGGRIPLVMEDFGANGAWGALLPLLVAVLVAGFNHTLPQYTEHSPRAEQPVAVIDFEVEFSDMRGMTAWTKEFPSESPLIEQYLAGKPLEKAHILKGEGSVKPLRHGGRSEEVLVASREGVTLQFYTYYYPGWRAYVDGRPVPIRPEGRYGLITLEVPPGEHRVLIRFEDTPLRFWAQLVSLISILAGVGATIFPGLSRAQAAGKGGS